MSKSLYSFFNCQNKEELHQKLLDNDPITQPLKELFNELAKDALDILSITYFAKSFTVIYQTTSYLDISSIIILKNTSALLEFAFFLHSNNLVANFVNSLNLSLFKLLSNLLGIFTLFMSYVLS